MIPISTLIVDDSPSFLQSAVRFLSMDNGIDIVGLALSGQEAIDQAEQLQPDLVLMDLAMPGMNGLEATRVLKSGLKPPRVVILTLHDTVEYRTAACEANADGFVAKSDFGAKLLPLIETLRESDAPAVTSQPDIPLNVASRIAASRGALAPGAVAAGGLKW